MATTAIYNPTIFANEYHHSSCIEKIQFWLYDHPTVVKVAQYALGLIGAGLLLSSVFVSSLVGIATAIGIGAAGVLLTVGAIVGSIALDFFVPIHHDMKDHAFEVGSCEGGSLRYEGDVPILTLDSDDPFKMGKAEGYLCGDALNALYKQFDTALHTFLRRPRAHDLPRTIAAVRAQIPPTYLQEMEGMLEGFQQWAKEHPFQFPVKVTLEDIILLHLIPDDHHFYPQLDKKTQAALEELKQHLAIACSAIVEQAPDGSITFARNMDWPSLNRAGKYSFVRVRKSTRGLRNTMEVGIPGLVGILTGMNDRKLCLAMNISPGYTTKVEGMPALLFNRYCLENCDDRAQVEALTHRFSPLGPYHLTIADPTGGETIHFKQSIFGQNVIRRCERDQPLITLNCCYSPTPDRTCNYEKRQEQIEEFFGNRNNRPLADVLACPYVNNWETTHRIVMSPTNGTFQVAFDNGFAGQQPLHTLGLNVIS